MDDSFYNEQMIHRSIIWDSQATWAKCYEACICQRAPEEASPKPALNGDGLCSTQNTRTQGHLLMMIQVTMEIEPQFILQR